MLQKKLIRLFLALREGRWVFLFTNTTIDDEELGLTFSRRFCLLESSVEKVGESSNCDSSFWFSSSKMCLLSRCNATSSSFNGNSL